MDTDMTKNPRYYGHEIKQDRELLRSIKTTSVQISTLCVCGHTFYLQGKMPPRRHT